jgi:predicted anti-sigma-YlaC factor YlaD
VDEPEITCQEIVELVTAYLEDAVSAVQRQRIEEHLVDCPGCRAYIDQMRVTIELAGRVDHEELDEDARVALLSAFRSWRET